MTGSLQTTESYQKDNSERLQSISNGVATLTASVAQLESKVEEIGRSHDDIISMKNDIVSLKANLCELSSTCQDMGYIAEQVDGLDNRLRRNNLIFKGIPEVHGETWSQTEQTVTDFIQTNLKINAGVIERAHRAGRKRNEYIRMIVVKYQNFKKKTENSELCTFTKKKKKRNRRP